MKRVPLPIAGRDNGLKVNLSTSLAIAENLSHNIQP